MAVLALLAGALFLNARPSPSAIIRSSRQSSSEPSRNAPDPPAALPGRAVALKDFPLSPGDSWRYRTRSYVTTASDSSSSPGDGEALVRVLSRRRQGNVTVFAVSRTRSTAPADLEISYGVVDGNRLFATIDPERFRTWLADPARALDPADAEFDFPMEPGKRWGSAAMLLRNDGLYVNLIGPEEAVDVPAGRFRAVPVEYRTLPDQMTTWIAPAAGMVRYEYLHHGSGDREVWDLLEFRHGPVDTESVARAVDVAFDRILAAGNFWSRRSVLASDVALRVLLGDLHAGETVDLEDGIRRYVVRGDSSSLVIDQVPDGPSWAYILKWRDRSRLIRTFVQTAPAASPADDAAERPAPNSPVEAARKDGGAGRGELAGLLDRAREDLRQARTRAAAGLESEAGALAEAAATRLAAGLAGMDLLALSPEDLKIRLRHLAGEDFLATRYGRRVRIDDGRLHVVMERAGDLLGMELSLNGDGGLSVGAAPRLLRKGPRGVEVRVLGEAGSSPAVCRILALDWSPQGEEPAVLVWRGALKAAPSGVEIFTPGEADQPVWTREIPNGTARLVGPPTRLELEYDEPDPEQPALNARWREMYRPPAEPGAAPILESRDLTNPWMRSVSLLVRALRGGDAAALNQVVRDESLRSRLSVTWLARSSVPLRDARSEPPTLAAPDAERRVSLTLSRGPVPSPENPGPEAWVLQMAPASDGQWIVVDLAARTSASWEP